MMGEYYRDIFPECGPLNTEDDEQQETSYVLCPLEEKYHSVAKLSIFLDSDNFIGTGFQAINNDKLHFITAAHNVMKEPQGQRIRAKLDAYFGLVNGEATNSKHIDAAELKIPYEFEKYADKWDYAISTEKASSETKCKFVFKHGFTAADLEILMGANRHLKMLGYPKPPEGKTYQGPVLLTLKSAWVDAPFIYYNEQSSGGHSGSPIFYEDENDKLTAVAVHVGYTNGVNRAVIFRNHFGYGHFIKGRLKLGYSHFYSLNNDHLRNVQGQRLDDIFIHPHLAHKKTDTNMATLQTVRIHDNYKEVIDDESRHIVIEGGPGYGKTTLVKKIVLDWVNGEFSLITKPYLFAIRARDVTSGKDLPTLINDTCKTNLEKEGTNFLSKFLDLRKSKIILLIDGIDEYTPGLNNMMDEIISGISYQEALIIMTTRPFARHRIYTPEHSKLLVIQEFDAIQVRWFCEQVLTGKDRRNNRIIRGFIYKSPEFDEFSKAFKINLRDGQKVPILLLFFCLIWKEKKVSPETRWDLFEEITKMLVAREYGEQNMNQELDSLGDIAMLDFLKNEDGMLLHRLSDMPEALNDFPTKSGLLSNLSDDDDFIEFHHKTLQEFIAARSLIRNGRLPEEFTDEIDNTIFNSILPVLQFCMENKEHDKLFKEINEQMDIVLQTVNIRFETSPQFWNFLAPKLRSIDVNQLHIFTTKSISKLYLEKLVVSARPLVEADLITLLNASKSLSFLHLQLKQLSLSMITRIVSHCPNLHRLNINENNLDDDPTEGDIFALRNLENLSIVKCKMAWKTFAQLTSKNPALKTIDARFNRFCNQVDTFQTINLPNLVNLNVRRSELQLVSFIQIWNNCPSLENFDASKNELGGEIPADIMLKPFLSLKTLEISGSQLELNAFNEVLKHAPNLQKVCASLSNLKGKLSSCEFKNSLNITYFEARHCSIELQTLLFLIENMPKLEKLFIQNNDLSEDIPFSLATGLKLPKLTEVNADHCYLKLDTLQCFMQASAQITIFCAVNAQLQSPASRITSEIRLSFLTQLFLEKSGADFKRLVSLLTHCQRLQLLNVDDNDFGETITSDVKLKLVKLKQLHAINTKMTLVNLSILIGNSIETIENIFLSCCNLTEPVSSPLQGFTKLQTLVLENSIVKSEAIQLLLHKAKELKIINLKNTVILHDEAAIMPLDLLKLEKVTMTYNLKSIGVKLFTKCNLHSLSLLHIDNTDKRLNSEQWKLAGEEALELMKKTHAKEIKIEDSLDADEDDQDTYTTLDGSKMRFTDDMPREWQQTMRERAKKLNLQVKIKSSTCQATFKIDEQYT